LNFGRFFAKTFMKKNGLLDRPISSGIFAWLESCDKFNFEMISVIFLPRRFRMPTYVSRATSL